MIVLAHGGHWLTNLIYLAPVLIVVVLLFGHRLRDRRAGITPQQREELDLAAMDKTMGDRW